MMDMLNWVYDGQQYVLETAHGKAIIVEVPDKARIIGAADRNKYLPHLELEDGTVQTPLPVPEFDDFETAEAFLLYHELAPLASTYQLSQTLQECAALLIGSNSHPTYLQRLQFLAKTLKLSELSLGRHAKFSAEGPETVELRWQTSDSHYSASTHHGTATIIEERRMKTRYYGGSDSYHSSLTHDSGASLRGPSFHTFEDAEEWIVSALIRLDHPRGEKEDVDDVIFTLDICIKLLPEDRDPIHYARIGRMQAEYSNIIL